MADVMHIHTDGSCLNNPGPGGWAAIVLDGQDTGLTLKGGEESTTNNRMELTAAIQGLAALDRFPGSRDTQVVLHTDAQYICKAFNENWIDSWIRKGWRTSKREPVANRDLWETLIELAQGFNITWQWVKGHSGDHYNELCDTIAREQAGQQQAGNHGTGSSSPGAGTPPAPRHSQDAAAPQPSVPGSQDCTPRAPVNPNPDQAGADRFQQGYEACRQEMLQYLVTMQNGGAPPPYRNYTDGYIDCRRELTDFVATMRGDHLPF